MTPLRFLVPLLATVAVLPASTIVFQFEGMPYGTDLKETFTYTLISSVRITANTTIPVSDLTACNECAPTGDVSFMFGIEYDFMPADLVIFPDQNGSDYYYYFPEGALTANGSYGTLPPFDGNDEINVGNLDLTGSPPVPEPNECGALVAIFLLAIGRGYYRERSLAHGVYLKAVPKKLAPP
jgi:hypothetical protein